MISFVLIGTTPAMEKSVMDEIVKFPCVEYVQFLFGEYDIIVKIREQDSYNVSDFVSNLRSVRGVADTKVLSGINW